ncbi:HPr kinase/phosphatase C-terminal domain-containing protein [Chelatococcus sp. SYSU_G07232]|uniref:HPr kinase/phosphatase C-terminal domain-containing protein n=1 Tax=Chelatococcus albus TaxID=3047466 RepID=A0ABT7AMG4_9HYPH|nr:HPr kinase/phosphatase C-terminal domain-containing protein [Chelatococcus sp. SYSU_G07232]MDJ1160147.1 HPr kinase/phosphatase C-terminal domain-containing protein [Chelatococcus sp. SYSU_G07232]
MSEPATIHATCVLVGEAGILIRGASGTGKSVLARRLVEEASRQGRFARLVADDRVRLFPGGRRIVARPVPAIAGMFELRGVGIVRMPYEAAAVLRLVVDCLTALPERMPEEEDMVTDVEGIVLPRLAVRVDENAHGLVMSYLALQEPSGAEVCMAE